MSASTHKDNLARIRDNQRRSRARRREYVQELEQRLRLYELQGIEASTEVQMAARRVAEENKQLRELLNRHAVSDENISHFLQTGTFLPLDSESSCSYRTGDPGSASQTLQHLLLPRRLGSMDQGFALHLPSQSSREASTASGSTTNSSVWEPPQSGIPLYNQQHHLSVNTASMGSAVHSQYPPTTMSGSSISTRHGNMYHGQPSPTMVDSPGQSLAASQGMSMGGRSVLNFHYSLPTFPDSTIPHYAPPGNAC
ncbi:hypothetical protein HIM_01420 [Hirsutella minnesotensis 3608]|nr:hypothetical protein HIM_01420 [Hirsutella minnesotensis 3608]